MFNEYSNLTTEQKAIEYIKCKNNIFYFIYNYVYIPEIGGSLKYTPEHMHLKLKRVIRSAIKFDKVIFMASRQLGKALSLDTLIPLPNSSYTTIDELKVGDIILGADGKPTTVKFITDVMYNHDCYKINFDYADSIIADADHLWKVNDNDEILTSRELFDIREKYIKATKPIEYTENNNLIIPPYIYGLWLSANINGTSSISVANNSVNEICEFITQYNYKPIISSIFKNTSEKNINILDFEDILNSSGLSQSRISVEYLINSIQNRVELLQGIMDGSGYCDTSGRCELKHSNLTLLFDIKQLLSSLGIKNKLSRNKNIYTRKYGLAFSTKDFDVFRVKLKKDRQKLLKGTRYNRHYIKSIEKIESVPVKCIQVDNEDKMFLAGEYIPTHNSTIAAVIIEYMLNFFPKNRAIIINMKKSAALENLSRIKFIHEMLPDFLKPCISNKVLADRKTYLEYENGSKVDVFYPSSISGPEQIARSLTSPILYIDESAFINHIHSAYGAAQPILSKARIQAKKHGYPTLLLMTSTPNGVEGTGKFFYDMWNKSVDSDEIYDEEEKLANNHLHYINDASTNGFISVKFHWSEIYDDKWYNEQVRELNFDSRRVNQELDLMFVAGSNCIFSDEYLTQLRPSKPVDVFDLPHMCKLKIYRELDPNDFYLVGVDTARSLVGDLCAIEIYKYSNFEQVGEFISRIGSLTKFSEVVKSVIKFLYTQVGKKFIVGVENNSMGIAIVESLDNDNEFDYMQFLYKEEQKRNSKVEKPYGIYTSQKSKDKMVALFYDEITTDPTLLHSGELISQLSIIEKDSMGRVAAQKGQHDDLFMASCFCALVKKDRQFEIEPQINVNSQKFLKDQEDLIQNIINIESKNKHANITDYFQDSEISRFEIPIIKDDKDIDRDFSNIPFPEFF